MRRLLLIALLAPIVTMASAHAAERHVRLLVEDAYLELHTGPGRGYPVFHSILRGEEAAVLKRRTDWFKVRAPRGQEGWVHREHLERTVQLDGAPFEVPGFTLGDHAGRRWEAGVLYGDFGGANAVSAYGAFNLTPNVSFELWLAQALGRFSNSRLATLNVVHTLYPQRRASPYLTLGGGRIHTEPKATLVGTIDRTDSLAHAGVGVRTYLTRRFVFRAEYKAYVVFTSRDDNEEIDEWKAGFSFFF